MTAMPTRPLSLTGMEVVFLSDALRNGAVIKEIEDEEPNLRPLLLLLASAYVELVDVSGIAPGPVTLYVSEAMTWLMRSKVHTGDMALDKTNLGIPLLRKLYGLLLSFESGLDGFEECDVDDTEATLEARVKLQEMQDARADKDTDTDASAVG